MEVESIVDAQVRSMLAGIERDLAQRQEQILAEANKQARALLKNARRQARSRVSREVAEEREQRDRSLQRADAALQSRIRRKRQTLDKEQLIQGHERLRQALVARWSDPTARSEWAQTLMEEADSLLANGSWQVEYPAHLDPVEAARLLDRPASDGRIERVPAEDIEAGFRLRRADAQLDMSVEGLLAQADDMAGELLAEIHRQQERLAANP